MRGARPTAGWCPCRVACGRRGTDPSGASRVCPSARSTPRVPLCDCQLEPQTGTLGVNPEIVIAGLRFAELERPLRLTGYLRENLDTTLSFREANDYAITARDLEVDERARELNVHEAFSARRSHARRTCAGFPFSACRSFLEWRAAQISRASSFARRSGRSDATASSVYSAN